ncbi:MAG: TatD family hydrolase [Thermoplasmata archaeon]
MMQQHVIFDNHFHLDFDGRCLDAVKDFEHAGGTHLLLVNKPNLEIQINNGKDFNMEFKNTLNLANLIRKETKVEVFVAMGPHPVWISNLVKKFPLEKAVDIMKKGIDVAGKYIIDDDAVAIGEIGRPHYKVPGDVWEASNRILRYGMEVAKENNCAVILHTENATKDTFAELASVARSVGLKEEKLVKHYSPPIVKIEDNHGLFPSILAYEDSIKKAISQGNRFMMETDYIDDIKRPGAVLGPATVPKKTRSFLERGIFKEEDVLKIHKENPEKIYNIEMKI